MYDDLVKRLHKQAVYLPEKFSKNAELLDVLMQAADAIEELISKLNHADEQIEKLVEAAEGRRWIPVTERLPEEDTDVLVVRKFLGIKGQAPPSTYVEIASRIGDDWCADSDEYKIARSKHTNPLYWMPLPTPPKEETE